ncbi:MAG TPA: serine dehydratase [Cytophagales bacterium]|nr:serine dehydratase [Cytophagales bacterium]
MDDASIEISPYTLNTPVFSSRSLNQMTGASLFFKCENFQRAGAFKMRGAAHAALRLTEEQRQKGLATHSSGNHRQAVAAMAQALGVPAYIVMPENSTKAKVAAVQGYGGEVIYCESTQAAREATLQRVVEEKGAYFIHPYDDWDVIAGQATCAKELLEEVDVLHTILVPVGGGGLVSGTCLSAKYLSPTTEVIGGEPTGADDAFRSFSSGNLVGNESVNTICDGLRASLGQKPFSIIQEHLTDIVTVTDKEVVHAMRLIWERMKIVIEPSCAVPFAVVLKNTERFAGKRLGIILTGGNVDVTNLPF